MPWLAVGLVATVTLVFGLLFGFSTAIIAGVLDDVAEAYELDTGATEALVSVLVLCAFLGALLASPMSARLGRRIALGIAAVLTLAGYAIILFDPTQAELVAARILIGLAVGISSMVAPMYAGEATPARNRGAIVSIYQLAVTIGILVAYTTPLALAGEVAWFRMMGLGIAIGVVGIVLVLMIPESPTWLARQGRLAPAQKAAVFLGVRYEMPAAKARGSVFTAAMSPGTVPLVLALCGGLFILQNLSGIDGILYYAPRIFEELGFDKGHAALTATFLLGAVNVIATILAILVVDRLGRRVLLLTGSALMIAGLLGVVAANLSGNATIGLLGLCGYIAAFAVSLGPLPYVMMSELFPAAIREPGIAFAAATSWLFNALVAFFFLSAMEALGVVVVFLFFAGICALSFVVGLIALPETKGVPLDEIEAKVLSGTMLRRIGR